MVNLDVAYIPTPKAIVRKMLVLARVRRDEVVFDLGAGDGRILLEAARRFGAEVTGIEIDPERVARIKERLRSTGVRAQLIEADFMDIDLSSADVVTMYLSESANSKLAPKLRRELRPGTRVVSLDYALPGWLPEKELDVTSGGLSRRLYFYQVQTP